MIDTRIKKPCPGCGAAKFVYDGRKKAATAAAQSRRASGETIRPYHCPGGRGVWHIGHPIGLWSHLRTEAA